MHKIILVFFLLGIICISTAQTLVVLNHSTSKPIEFVKIRNAELHLELHSDEKGNIDISRLKGVHDIEISSLGFKTVKMDYDDIEKNNFEISLQPSVMAIDEIVVSATRWSQASSSVPSKISKISIKDILLQNPQTAADLLGNSGEVFIQKSQQGGGSPMIRGFSANRLLYTIDGVRMNSAIFRSGNIQNVISIDPFSLENTEVFFGPGSIIYGSDAIGAVMSFSSLSTNFSSNEKMTIDGKINARTSSANQELTNHFDLSLGWKRWATVSSFTHSRFGDLRMGSKGPNEYLSNHYVQRIDSLDRIIHNSDPRIQRPSGYSQMNLMQKFKFSPSQNVSLKYDFHYSESSDFARYDRLLEKQKSGLPVYAVWNYGPQKWMMNHFSFDLKNNNKVFDNMAVQLAHQYFEESRIDRRLYATRLRTNVEKVHAYSVNVDFVKNLSKQKIYYGLEFVLNDVNSKGSAVDILSLNGSQVPARYPLSIWNSYASYLNYQYNISKHILLQAGVRYSIFEIESDFSNQLNFFNFDFTKANIKNSAFNSSIGLLYKSSDGWKVSLNGSTGFRAPNVDDIGKVFDFAAGEIVVPNSNLKSEYAYNGELILSKQIGELVKFDMSAFYTYLDNSMVRRPFKIDGKDSVLYDGVLSKVYAIQNAAFATVYGFNFGVEFNLTGGFKFMSRLNYQLGKEELNDGTTSPARHAAPAFGMSRLSFSKEKLDLQFYSHYSAAVSNAKLNEEEKQKVFIYAKDHNGNPYSPAWYSLNFKAMYQFLPKLSCSAGIENITDIRYRPYSSGLVAAGRNLVFSIMGRF
jgi:hemoglobin/transferrin/lactoferrin receptor protein